MAIVELDLNGLNIDQVKWRGDVLRANFGGGYGAAAVVGPTAGLHEWELSDGGVSPDRDDADHLPIDGVSRFEYYYEFFKDHTTGTEEVFIIEWRGKKWHASFSDPDLSAEQMTSDLFGITGVRIRQRRVAGIIYNDDGSIDLDPPGPLEDFRVIATTDMSITVAWDFPANVTVYLTDSSANNLTDNAGNLLIEG
jgi:hypothetical protein